MPDESKPERREPPEPWRWGAERPMTDRAVEVVEAKDYDVLARKHKELMEEANSAHELIMRQGDLLRGVVNAIRGEPPEDTLWSHHDAPELARDLKADRDALRAQLAEVIAQKDAAYSERNKLLALLTTHYESWLEQHPNDPDWEPDWRTIVFMNLPTGQASWHIHDSERDLFSLPEMLGVHSWDGHTTEEKYDRLLKSARKRMEAALTGAGEERGGD